jgi:RNA polymerase sigma-70 factor (ECF subfamily)
VIYLGDEALPASELSDAGLVVAISRYHQEALAEAYRRHAGAVFGLARRLLSDVSLAEEVVQEVFLRLWNTPEKFDPGRGSLRSYLLAQCHGRSVDLIRAESSRRKREDRDVRQTAAPPWCSSPTGSGARSSSPTWVAAPTGRSR